jgi:hypothetical protein
MACEDIWIIYPDIVSLRSELVIYGSIFEENDADFKRLGRKGFDCKDHAVRLYVMTYNGTLYEYLYLDHDRYVHEAQIAIRMSCDCSEYGPYKLRHGFIRLVPYQSLASSNAVMTRGEP